MAMAIAGLKNWLDHFWLPAAVARRVPQAFHLRRWFGIISLVSIALLAIVGAAVFSRLMTERMLRQEAQLTTEFVQATFLVEKPAFFYGERGQPVSDVTGILVHLSTLPDVLRANVYTRERKLFWSSDASLIGKQFDGNPELERALRGELVVNEEDEEEELTHAKNEHQNLSTRDTHYFVEIYVPVWDVEHRNVLGVVELYKQPRALFEAIQFGNRLIWSGAIGGSLFLYLMLFGMISRADALIRNQQARLVENERLAAVGELGSAVAHGIRNPLTAIRSSAELALEGDPELSRDAARDIMAETDRLERWVNELLSYSRPVAGNVEGVGLTHILSRCMEEFGREFERREIVGAANVPANLPDVVGDAMLFGQVFNSLIANSIEAIGQQGSIAVSAAVAPDGEQVQVSIRDSGPGMSREQLANAFKPFFTTKTKGLGVGLPLAKRIVERFGGSIVIGSEPGHGTTVQLAFAVAR